MSPSERAEAPLPDHKTAPSLARYSFHVRHGFFGRKGGVSEGPYATLNASARSGDKLVHVSRNRELIAASLGMSGTLLTPLQEHTARALRLDRADLRPDREAADALVTDLPGLVLGVLSADCAPILIGDPSRGVIAAIHAGWRGSLGGVIEATLDVMSECKADMAHSVAAIGPSLGPDSFEVGPEFIESFTEAFPWSESLFTPTDTDRYLFDHPAFIMSKLTRAGIGLVESLSIDTLTEDKDYFSYRRARRSGQADYGCNASAIVLLE